MKPTKEGRTLNLDLGPAHFCGVHRDSWSVFGLWISPTQFQNIMVATSVEIRLAWLPVRCVRGWVGTE